MRDPQKIASVLERLGWARLYDRDCQLFGAWKHRYEMRPPFPEEAIREFEARHGLGLPGEYRDFIRLVGNGGYGPDYGLAPLGDQSSDPFSRTHYGFTAEPGRPFQLDQVPQGPWPKGTHPFDGCAYLADIGCGHFFFLALNGPSAGQVCAAGSSDTFSVRPVSSSFDAWYEGWLDERVVEAGVSEVLRRLVRGDWESDPLLLGRTLPLARARVDQPGRPLQAREALDLGYLWLHAHDHAEASRWFSTAGKLHSSSGTRFAQLALLWERGERAAFLRATEGAVDSLGAPERRRLTLMRARARQELGDVAGAAQELDGEINRSGRISTQPELAFARARLQLEAGDVPGAESTLQALLAARAKARFGADPLVGRFAETLEGGLALQVKHFVAWSQRLGRVGGRGPST